MTIQPIVRTVEVKTPPAEAFALFTARMGAWWPMGRGTGKQPLVDVVMEPRVGGRWFERDKDGAETQWGDVLAWEPPRRLLLAWRLDSQFHYDPNFQTEVELTFSDGLDGGAVVTLEHRDLEKFGADAERLAASLGGGWASRLQDYSNRANQS